MQIIRFSPRGFGANTYAITADNKTAIVIDPSRSDIAEALLQKGLRAEYVLLTHCHFDHVGGVQALQNAGAKVLCSAEEKPLIGTSADLFDMAGLPRKPYRIDETLTDNEERILCGVRVKTLLTPGHTKGSVCYLMEDNEGGRYLFTGDTLFNDSVGRTDFPTGDASALYASLQRLIALDDMPVYAGHNEETTLAAEKRHNPFLAD